MSITKKDIEEDFDDIGTGLEFAVVALESLKKKLISLFLEKEIPEDSGIDIGPEKSEWKPGLIWQHVPDTNDVRIDCPNERCTCFQVLDAFVLGGTIPVHCRECGLVFYIKSINDEYHYQMTREGL